jgi:hypothetical protein
MTTYSDVGTLEQLCCECITVGLSVAVACKLRRAEFFKNYTTDLKSFVEVAFIKSSSALSQLEVS